MCDYDDKPHDADGPLLTYEEWWEAWRAEACCHNEFVAAQRLCGCRGSGAIPSGISRLLRNDDHED